jgi:hypothetical protein
MTDHIMPACVIVTPRCQVQGAATQAWNELAQLRAWDMSGLGAGLLIQELN